MTNVTLRQLRAFVLIAKERSFTRAASRLHVSPSALTITIRELEAEIGMRLFDRSTRTVEPTPQALGFQPVAERLLEELGRALDDLRSYAERKKGFVTVAGASSVITFVIAPAIAALAKAHPGISVRLIEDHTEGLAKRVLSGEVDFGITTLLRPIDGIDARLLLRDRFGVMFPAEHPFASQRGPVSLSALSGVPLIALGTGAGIRDLVDQHPALTSVLPRPAYEASSVHTLQTLVSQNVGVALVPALTARSAAHSGVGFRSLNRPSIFRGLFFVSARSRTLWPAAAALAEHALSNINNLGEGTMVKVRAGLRLLDLLGPASTSKPQSCRRLRAG